MFLQSCRPVIFYKRLMYIANPFFGGTVRQTMLNTLFQQNQDILLEFVLFALMDFLTI